MSCKINESEYNDIINMYNNGNSIYDIANKYKVSGVTISRILNKSGVKTRGSSKYNYKDIVFTQIKDDYTKGEKISVLEAKYDMPRNIIMKYLKLSNVEIRDNSAENRKYEINEHYFNDINSENKAYFLGLLFADGCNNGKNITISLSDGDEYILKRFANEVFPNKDRELYCYKLSEKNPNHRDSYSLSICNKNIKNDLNRHGVVQRKSLILKYPNELSDVYFKDFLRGYFDGDGCVRLKRGRNEDSPPRVSFSILGTDEFLNCVGRKMVDLFKLKYGFKIYEFKNTSIKELRVVAIDDVLKVFKSIYNNTDLYLVRKYDKMREVFKLRGSI